MRLGRKAYLSSMVGQGKVRDCLLEVTYVVVFLSSRWLLLRILLYHVERRRSIPGAVCRVVVGIDLQPELLAKIVAIGTETWPAAAG